jgi:uncharacterized protein YcfJ
MLKRILIVGVMVALTGCATHQQANTAVGAGVGAVIGNAVGGRGGAVAGAVLGTAIGSQQPTYNYPHVVEQQVIVQQPRYYQQTQVCYTDGAILAHRRDMCMRSYSYDPMSRSACFHQAEQFARVCSYR